MTTPNLPPILDALMAAAAGVAVCDCPCPKHLSMRCTCVCATHARTVNPDTLRALVGAVRAGVALREALALWGQHAETVHTYDCEVRRVVECSCGATSAVQVYDDAFATFDRALAALEDVVTPCPLNS